MLFRIYRMKDGPREQFRWAAHTGGPAAVKAKDYEVKNEIEAASPYAAWKALVANGDPLHTGDLLEEIAPDGSAGGLHIAKYVGIEKATWLIPEAKTENQPSSCV